METNKKTNLNAEQLEALNYIWGTITPAKKALVNQEIDLKKYEVLEMTKDAKIVREKLNLDKMRELALCIKGNNITINDLILKKYYVAAFNGRYNLFKKYTSIVEDFKKDNPGAIVSFNVEPDNYVECVIKDINTNIEIKNKTLWSEAAKTNRPKIDFLRTKAFKDILRYNYPKYVEFYDEYDEDIIAGTKTNDKEADAATTQELFKKLKEKIGE